VRILLIYAHPIETSFHAALHDTIRARLAGRHTVEDCDPYSEGFGPRKLDRRVLRATVTPGASVSYPALYAVNVASEAPRPRFIADVAARMEAF
jgi:putative NADPH-quinone reductase